MVWCSHLSKSFLQFVMIHTVKSFSVVDETEKDVFLEFPCFLYNPMNVGSLQHWRDRRISFFNQDVIFKFSVI